MTGTGRRKPVSDQVIAIAGTASGIGRETALQAARRGARLVVSDIDPAGLSSLVDEIRQSGGDAESVVADVADSAVRRFGCLDTWIHVAAAGLWATFMDTTPEEFRRMIEVALLGQVHGARAAPPHIIRGGGGGLIHGTNLVMPFDSFRLTVAMTSVRIASTR